MPQLPGINHERAVRALEKAGLGGIVRDAGLTIEEFRKLL
jgi:hypothetical protein